LPTLDDSDLKIKHEVCDAFNADQNAAEENYMPSTPPAQPLTDEPVFSYGSNNLTDITGHVDVSLALNRIASKSTSKSLSKKTVDIKPSTKIKSFQLTKIPEPTEKPPVLITKESDKEAIQSSPPKRIQSCNNVSGMVTPPKKQKFQESSNYWYNRKPSDNIKCLWCYDRIKRSSLKNCKCNRVDFHIKLVGHHDLFKLAPYLTRDMNMEKIIAKTHFNDESKDWMVCTRDGFLCKTEKEMLVHFDKKHDDCKKQFMCRYCPSDFKSQQGFLDHQICKKELQRMTVPDILKLLGPKKQHEFDLHYNQVKDYKDAFKDAHKKTNSSSKNQYSHRISEKNYRHHNRWYDKNPRRDHQKQVNTNSKLYSKKPHIQE